MVLMAVGVPGNHVQPGGGRDKLAPQAVGHSGGDRYAYPASQPLDRVGGGGGRIEVCGQAVQRADYRGENLVQPLAQPLREAVIGVERRGRTRRADGARLGRIPSLSVTP